jgi:hypothetical protein
MLSYTPVLTDKVFIHKYYAIIVNVLVWRFQRDCATNSWDTGNATCIHCKALRVCSRHPKVHTQILRPNWHSVRLVKNGELSVVWCFSSLLNQTDVIHTLRLKISAWRWWWISKINILHSSLFHRAFSLTVFIGSNKCTILIQQLSSVCH